MTTRIEELNQFMVQSPFNAWLGCHINSIHESAQEIEIELPARPEIQRGNSTSVHGGVIAALVDVAAHPGLHALTGFGMPTIDLKVDYLAPAEMPLRARAVARRIGRTVGFVDVEVFDVRKHLVALGRAVFLTRPPVQ